MLLALKPKKDKQIHKNIIDMAILWKHLDNSDHLIIIYSYTTYNSMHIIGNCYWNISPYPSCRNKQGLNNKYPSLLTLKSLFQCLSWKQRILFIPIYVDSRILSVHLWISRLGHVSKRCKHSWRNTTSLGSLRNSVLNFNWAECGIEIYIEWRFQRTDLSGFGGHTLISYRFLQGI